MTVYVTNYTAGNPKVGVRLDTALHQASSWHKRLDPKHLGPVEVVPGLVCENLRLACQKYGRMVQGRPLSLYQYRLDLLGRLYMKHIVETEAFTKCCNIYDRDGVLILRDRDADPWHPGIGAWTSVFRRADFRITHTHVLAAMLMADPVTEQFKELRFV